MPIASRPTDMLLRQLDANRRAARWRNPANGRRHYCHEPRYRRIFVVEMLAMRAELRSRAGAENVRKHNHFEP